jgi:competence protein ComEA
MTSRAAAVAAVAAALAAAGSAVPGLFLSKPSPPPALRLDLNVASARELDLLPGVGPKTAALIVADRAAHGPFHLPSDIRRVKGVTHRAAERIAQFTEAR